MCNLAEDSNGEEVWDVTNDESGSDTDEFESAPSLPNVPDHSTQEMLLRWILLFLIQLQVRFTVSDNAITFILKFLNAIFCILGRFSDFASTIAVQFPTTLYQFKKRLPTSDQFKRFIVCRKCLKLYHYGECVTMIGSSRSSKACNFVRYPKHPFHSHRNPCGQLLLKTVQLTSGKTLLYPYKVYCYKSLQSSLQELLVRPGFYESCHQWKLQSEESDGKLLDVYHGRIWKEFFTLSGQPFLSTTSTLALMLNVDWFQPFKHTTYSVGAIYLSIMNLPRSLRFRSENMILVSIISGPSEPKIDMNTYLDPLVNELNQFLTGISLNVKEGSATVSKKVRCALLCCACDLPAGRKLCGFLGHSASLGCSKCLKIFPGTVGNKNYSGFDRAMWPARNTEAHRENVKKILECKTKTERAQKESEFGCRYSSLLRLPYFDPCRMSIIDPMHNIFLGSAKHILHLWLDQNIISFAQFEQIQECVDGFVVPSDIGRIPLKIKSGFAGFTADQFKNWITLFSIPALFGILTGQHLECWRHFVIACRILCKRSLLHNDIILADVLLMKFCTRVQELYGENAVTPNMHMHGHLKETLLDYGPVYGFWLFPYERLNGILGKQHTSNRLIEPQLMKRFLTEKLAYSFEFPEKFADDLGFLLETDQRVVGSVSDTINSVEDMPLYTLPKKFKYGALDEHERDILRMLYIKLNQSDSEHVMVTPNMIYKKYSSLCLKGRWIGYTSLHETASNVKPCIVMAEWDSNLYGNPPPVADPTLPNSELRAVKVHNFVKISFTIDHEDLIEYMVLAVVSWYSPHLSQHVMGKPAQVWCHDLFEPPYGIHSYLPIEKISSFCVYCKSNIQDENVLVVVPLCD